MATINFYNTTSDDIVVNKALTLVTTRTLQFNQFDRTNLSLMLKENIDANYCLIENRYYYVADKIIDGKIVYYYLKCDVLMTFKDAIYNSTQFVDRNQFTFNSKKIDNLVETQVDVNKEYITLTPEFDANNVMPTSLEEDADPHFIISIYK